jgi:hypothetical protein
MKTTFYRFNNPWIRFATIMPLLLASFFLPGTSIKAQIYEPEGLNMPGAWNTWVNPPANNLALASSTQVTGGKIVKIATGTVRWQTRISVAATGGDLTGGTYEWLFTSGSTSNYYQNKWSAVNVITDSLQEYIKEGSANNSITLVNGMWYTMNFEDLGYANTHAIFMKTSALPVNIISVISAVPVVANDPVTISVELSGPKCPEENIFIRYSTDAWATSAVVAVSFTGSTGLGQIPGQPAGTVVSYYAFSTTLATVNANFDMVTINLNNNGGTNYSYSVGATAPAITFANLQWPGLGMISPAADFLVYGDAYIAGLTGLPTPAAGLQAWVGYSTTNTDPATWTNWITATYNAPIGNNDEFKTNLGAALTNIGTYYYATRFRLNADPYTYGGYSATGGGFWNGTTNVSGILDVSVGIPEVNGQTYSVCPNPTHGLLQLNFPSPAQVSLFDALGRMLISKDCLQGRQEMDISGFRNGVYYMKINTGDQITRQTIIKQ